MIVSSSYSSIQNKKIDSYSLTDNLGNRYLFVRIGNSKAFFNIAKCEVRQRRLEKEREREREERKGKTVRWLS
jgi:hypothetical protein